MAVVEIDWNGVHVLQWFFDPGYELQMSQDEILADVSAKIDDTHLEKLVKFMRTVEVLRIEFKQHHDDRCLQLNIFPKASRSALQIICFFISVFVNLFVELVGFQRPINPANPSDVDTEYEFVVSTYFAQRQLLTQTAIMTIRSVAIWFQVGLFVIHIILLVCEESYPLPGLGDGNYTPPTNGNSPNKCCGRIHKTCFSEHHRVRTTVHTLSLRIFFLLCAILSFWQPFFQSFILFDVVSIWPSLAYVTDALFTAIPKVASIFVMLFVIIYAFAKLQFFYLRKYFVDGACDSLATCFFTASQMGFAGSFEKLAQYHPAREHADWVWAHIVFTCSFIIIVNIIFMNVILGTIVSSFNKLQEEKSSAVTMKMDVCYICSLSRRQMDKTVTTVHNAFDQHKQCRHNLLSYVRFIFYIRSKNPNELTGAEHYVLQQLESLETGWFPKSQHAILSHED